MVENGPVALGHALLASTPEALTEQMPLRHAPSGCIITADARLDNRTELIAALGLDPAGRTIGDGELILRAYLKWEQDCPEHLLGDFAFVLWDAPRQRLFAARDKVGMRQLTYHFSPGNLFACATDSEALLAHPDVPRRINLGRVADFIDEMESIDEVSTMYEKLCRLPRAHALTLENGSLKLWRYWQLQAFPLVYRNSEAAYDEAFLDVFTQAVRARLRSAGGLGSMLSGGMDSGSVVAVAARLLNKASMAPLRTFSAVHEDPDCLESAAIRLAMTTPHIEPHLVSTGKAEEFRHEVSEMIRTCPEPFDGHMAMVMTIYARARQDGIKVMLDGVSGDTTLATGNVTQWLLAKRRLGPAWREAWGDQLYWGHHYKPALRLFLRDLRAVYTPPELRRIWHQITGLLREGAAPRDLLNPDFAHLTSIEKRREINRANNATGNDCSGETRARKMLHPRVIAGRERYDRIAGRLGIEPRDPFLDVRLLEHCLTIPVDRIKRDGWPKLILRRSMADLMPASLRWRTGRTHVGGWYIAACNPSDPVQLAEGLAERLKPYVDGTKIRDLGRSQNTNASLALLTQVSYLDHWLSRSAMTGNEGTEMTNPGSAKIAYDTPTLTIYGHFSQLTASGSGSKLEGRGVGNSGSDRFS